MNKDMRRREVKREIPGCWRVAFGAVDSRILGLRSLETQDHTKRRRRLYLKVLILHSAGVAKAILVLRQI